MHDIDENVLRLAARSRIIEIIHRRRAMEGDMGIGASIERQILWNRPSFAAASRVAHNADDKRRSSAPQGLCSGNSWTA